METGPARTTEHNLYRSIAAIYEAAVASDRWTAALGHLRDMFALGSTVYVVHTADRSHIDRISAEIDPEGHQANVNSLLRGSIFYTRGKGWQSGQVTRTNDMIPAATFHNSQMYQEYWRPRGLSEGLRLTVSVDSNGVYHGLNLLRAKSRGAFEEADLTLAEALMPHLRSAVELRQRLRHIDMLAAAALTALDALRHAIVLLEQDARVSHTNKAADALLARSDGLSVIGGLLQAAIPSCTNRLHAAVASAAGIGGTPARAGAVHLPRRNGQRALALLLMPFRTETHWTLSHRPSVLVCIADPDPASALSGRKIADLFGLTGAEAALATDLLAGWKLRDIAERRGRSITTIRSHLANLMAKTDVNRQSELLRLLAELPQLRDPI